MRMIFGRTDIELLVKGDLDVGHAAMLHHGSHRVHGDGVRGCQADFLHVRLQDSLRIDWSRPSFHFFFLPESSGLSHPRNRIQGKELQTPELLVLYVFSYSLLVLP